MSKKTALEQLKKMGRRPTVKEIEGIARKHNRSTTNVYRWVKEVYGPARGEAKPEAPAVPAEPAPAEEALSIQPTEPPVIHVEERVVDPAGMPDFAAPPPPEAAPPGAGPTPGPMMPGADPATLARGIVETMTMVFEHHVGSSGEPQPPGPITEAEKQALAQAWGPFVVKYAPMYGRYAVEVNVIVATLAVFGPRYQYAKAQQAKREAEQKLAAEEPPLLAPLPPRDDLDVGDRISRKLGALR